MKTALLILAICQLPNPENIRVHDGDTIVVDLPGLPDVFGKDIGVRLLGIDAPEIHDKDAIIRSWAERAKRHLEERVGAARKVELSEPSRDKYFRLDAKVFLDGEDVQDELLRKGLAKPYDGGTKDAWKPEDVPLMGSSGDYESAYALYPKVPMLVMVGAKWCAACPEAERKAKAILGDFSFAKVDYDSEPELVLKLGGVRSLPTFFVFVHGKPSVRTTGYDERRLRGALNGFLKQEKSNVGVR